MILWQCTLLKEVQCMFALWKSWKVQGRWIIEKCQTEEILLFTGNETWEYMCLRGISHGSDMTGSFSAIPKCTHAHTAPSWSLWSNFRSVGETGETGRGCQPSLGTLWRMEISTLEALGSWGEQVQLSQVVKMVQSTIFFPLRFECCVSLWHTCSERIVRKAASPSMRTPGAQAVSLWTTVVSLNTFTGWWSVKMSWVECLIDRWPHETSAELALNSTAWISAVQVRFNTLQYTVELVGQYVWWWNPCGASRPVYEHII